MKAGTGFLTLYARQVAIGNVEDYDRAVAAINELIDLINRTWERRVEITPVFESRPRPLVVTLPVFLNCAKRIKKNPLVLWPQDNESFGG